MFSVPGSAQSLAEVSKEMVQKTVPIITVNELAKETAQSPVLLLDTREKAEYEVSHLPQSVWIGYDDFKLERLNNANKATKIIVYCSVGYRSEKIGEKLLAAGYTNVQNLFGGLFTWANQGHPLVDQQGKATTSVHGFNKEWSRHLSKDLNKVLP